MIGVNCLQDLKARLTTAGFEILVNGQGWYVETVHGRWTMLDGDIYLNTAKIKTIAEAPIPKKPIKVKKEPKVKKPAKKKKAKKKS